MINKYENEFVIQYRDDSFKLDLHHNQKDREGSFWLSFNELSNAVWCNDALFMLGGHLDNIRKVATANIELFKARTLEHGYDIDYRYKALWYYIFTMFKAGGLNVKWLSPRDFASVEFYKPFYNEIVNSGVDAKFKPTPLNNVCVIDSSDDCESCQ